MTISSFEMRASKDTRNYMNGSKHTSHLHCRFWIRSSSSPTDPDGWYSLVTHEAFFPLTIAGAISQFLHALVGCGRRTSSCFQRSSSFLHPWFSATSRLLTCSGTATHRRILHGEQSGNPMDDLSLSPGFFVVRCSWTLVPFIRSHVSAGHMVVCVVTDQVVGDRRRPPVPPTGPYVVMALSSCAS